MEFLNKLKEKIKLRPLRYGAVILLALSAILFMFNDKAKIENIANPSKGTMYIFVQDGCVYCMKAERYLAKIKNKYPDINFEYYNLEDQKNIGLLMKYSAKAKLDVTSIGTPIFIYKDRYVLGFASELTTGLEITRMLDGEIKPL